MKLLILHTNFVEYEPVEIEGKVFEEAEPGRKRFEEIILVLTTMEEGDDEATVDKAVSELKGYSSKVGSRRILIYPYAHLSNKLATPERALELVRIFREKCGLVGMEVYTSPFGWTKALSLSIKGHPLAEQFRSITPEAASATYVPKALVMEERIRSYWYILTPDGKLTPVESFDFSGHEGLKALAVYEMAKSRAVLQTPPHVDLMKKLEIADYEPGSDLGNIRWPAKGRLIKSLIEHYVTEKVIEYGGMEIETPIMYDLKHPCLESYLNRFPARQYIVKSDEKEFFLRFAACFGQFLMAHDMQVSYKQLPVRLYELTRYSFRREKSGELVGLKRLRAFTMPDVHALCADIQQAKEEMLRRFELSINVLEGIGLTKDDYEMAIRFTKDFYESNKEFVTELVKTFGKPALVEMWEERFFYFVLKWEFNFIDNLGKASALSTDQIDVENAERYDITYVDQFGNKRYPIILHCSPSGAIERVIYALLEKAYKAYMEGGKPMLPVWLSPTQIRLIPVSDAFVEDCVLLSERLESEQIRVDVDDRSETVDKKVRDAETEWVPYIIVFGKREKESNVFSVRDRASGSIKQMTIEELIREIRSKTAGRPYKRLSLPRMLSKRPSFR
ncbi:MAG: threonine--tRNA ligase [Nitrososphaerota archaeon]|nr:threonine--tRNA ligase [Aigarchaeota archaeon]MDW8076919.1 threonine--tRNA ligase [Nitrososphaerota archaeon]